MGIKESQAGINDYAEKLIRKKASQLIGKYGFTRSDKEDIEQTLKLDLLIRLQKFNPNDSSHNTFITCIVKNKIASIIKYQKAAKRDYKRCARSLNDLVPDEDSEDIELGDTIDQHEYLRRTCKVTLSASDHRDMVIDVQDIIRKLPPYLQEVCKCLQKGSAKDAANEIGIHRSTLYQYIMILRALLGAAGLRSYLHS